MLGLVAILVLVGVNVVMRYLLASPLGWDQEIVMYVFISISLLGISLAYRRGRHLQLYGVQALLSDSARLALRLVVSVVIAAFLVYLLTKAIRLHEIFLRFYSPLNRMPRALLTSALLWSLSSMLLSTVYFIVELITRRQVRPIDIFERLGLAGSLSRAKFADAPSRDGTDET